MQEKKPVDYTILLRFRSVNVHKMYIYVRLVVAVDTTVFIEIYNIFN